MSEVLAWYILYVRQDLTAKDIERLVAEKEALFGDLLDREVVLKLVAMELGIPVPVQKREPKLTLKDLVDDLHGLQLTVTVAGIEPVSEFRREDGTTGRLAKLRVRDESGERHLLLWNEKASLVEKVRPQQKVLISGAYTKKNKFGEVELNLGRSGEIEPVEG